LHLKKDIELIEGVQQRATKLMRSLRDKNYENSLRASNLTTLETRRLRGDSVEVFKIFKGIDNLEAQKLFGLSNTLTRGLSLRLVKHQHHLDCQKFSSH
jgi:ribonuclease P/MRP protein subunit RPP40